ncbi:hypothetical protein JDV02_010751 [Purpureocillium takamizusanense]|uniref:Haloacid dehalogenase n=1 Tax=Purpureocillium takamizusanense TaxID=2060973 RepID=A0A9Q8QSW9_9HYPO|nr:uncharacterized protein JDV02_010751 [Purpureocillium takamizusanense]UNI25043.1 hypothetical protein JDV02_010751 [Purpureocillium takamizusanense]
MPTSRPITSFKCLTFDCYGTLVDWEGGIYKALSPLLQQLPASHPLRHDRAAVLKAFVRTEGTVQRARPDALYSAVLSDAYGRLAAELGVQADAQEQDAFGQGVGDWPAYPDTVAALQQLKRHYKLVILSNVDRDSFARTLSRQLPGVDFDAVYTAQEIGSYKPDLRNFAYLIRRCGEDLGVGREDIVHTAQALHHDHVPAKESGLVSAWIDRGVEIKSVMGGDIEDYRDKVDLSWHFRSMGEMADAVKKAAAAQVE